MISQSDQSHWGRRNIDRYVGQYNAYFNDLLEDTRYPGYVIICNPGSHNLARDHIRTLKENQYALTLTGPSIAFTRDHVRETRERNDMYYRLIPNAIIRHRGFYDNEARRQIRQLQENINAHERVLIHLDIDRFEYRHRFQAMIIENEGLAPPINMYTPVNMPPEDPSAEVDEDNDIDLQQEMDMVAGAEVTDRSDPPDPPPPSSTSTRPGENNNSVFVLNNKLKYGKTNKFNNHTFIALDTTRKKPKIFFGGARVTFFVTFFVRYLLSIFSLLKKVT